MVEMVTEVCLATVQLYLEKSAQERSPKLEKLALESMNILGEKQNQFTEADKKVYEQGLKVFSLENPKSGAGEKT